MRRAKFKRAPLHCKLQLQLQTAAHEEAILHYLLFIKLQILTLLFAPSLLATSPSNCSSKWECDALCANFRLISRLCAQTCALDGGVARAAGANSISRKMAHINKAALLPQLKSEVPRKNSSCEQSARLDRACMQQMQASTNYLLQVRDRV